MSSGPNRSTTASRQNQGQIVMLMPISVSEASAVNDHAVVEQRPVSLGDRFQTFQQVSELMHVKPVDLTDLHLLCLIALMMR